MATQVALVANSVSWAGHMCTAQQLAAPAARAHTRALFALLSPLSHVSPLPVFSLGGVEPPAAEVQCATLLRFSQLVCGLAALVWQAATQARLHAAHQQQRREAGLPPERGASARILGILGELFADPLVRLQRWLAAALAVGLCWQLALAVGLQEEAA